MEELFFFTEDGLDAHERLTGSARNVLNAILRSAKKSPKNGCSISITQLHISRSKSVHLDTVKRAYRELKDAGFIVVEERRLLLLNPYLVSTGDPMYRGQLKRIFDEKTGGKYKEHADKPWTRQEVAALKDMGVVEDE